MSTMFYFIINATDVDLMHNTEAQHSVTFKVVIIHLLSNFFVCLWVTSVCAHK